MTTKATILAYFDSLKRGKGWESFLSDEMSFTSFTSPIKEVKGKDAYIQSTKRFYSTIASMQVRELIVEGSRACALTRYELQPPVGNRFVSDVAEVFIVEAGKISSFSIYFDTAPFPK